MTKRVLTVAASIAAVLEKTSGVSKVKIASVVWGRTKNPYIRLLSNGNPTHLQVDVRDKGGAQTIHVYAKNMEPVQAAVRALAQEHSLSIR